MTPAAAVAGAVCAHFGTCGGCATQDVPYAEQLAAKERLVRAAVAPFSPAEFLPIAPSPDVWFYRNKMEFAFGGLKGAPPRLGLREKGRFDRVVDVEDCRLLSPETPRLLRAARDWAAREGVPTYHTGAHKGFLRYLAVREGKNTGERMVHLVTSAGDLDRGSFLAALDGAGVRIDTVVWSVNATPSDVAYGQTSETLRGPGWITETLGGRPFRISPNSFFQTNSRGAELLYAFVRELAGPAASTLFDFYCGSGTIGLFCARAGTRIVGIESNASAVADARANAERQGVAAEFHAMDAAQFAAKPELVELWGAAGNVAVFDPPRVGLAAPVRRLLLERPVERFVYVSCNPEALARDLALLNDGYSLESVRAVDMFPHTPHVETVALLARRAA